MSLNQAAPTRIIDSRHPSFFSSMTDWERWRLTYKSGEEFKHKYLEHFSTREDRKDFKIRSRLTPIPAFAKSAINDIRNSIFQRMRDITRYGGSEAYRQAVAGLNLGVDRRGSTMNAFLGQKVLTELLVMGRCGIYVDNSILQGESIADSQGARPYLYTYQVEDIMSWTCALPDKPSEFQSVLLRDTCLDYDRRTLLPLQTFERFRLLWIDEGGQVNLQFYALDGSEIDRNGQPSFGPTILDLTRIPFIMPDIGDSMIKDACSYQIALLNLCSRDVWYALQSNFPFYIEQKDMRAIGSHLKPAANEDGTATTGGQGSSDADITVGATHGRTYAKDTNAPAFINPSPDPLRASIQLEEKYEADIRKVVNLSVQTVATRGSAESKSLDNQGLEAGLSFIGLVLESAERQVNEHWAAYESKTVSQREIATVKYPDRYSLKTDADRIKESGDLSKLIYSVPGRVAKKEIAKNIIDTLLGGKVDVGTIDAIKAEIDKSDYLTSEPNTIVQAVEAGLCDLVTGSAALGFADGVAEIAKQEQIDRAVAIIAAQTAQMPGPTVVKGSKAAQRSIQNPAARGVEELQTYPQQKAADEKTAAELTAPSKSSVQRGNAKDARVTGKQKA